MTPERRIVIIRVVVSLAMLAVFSSRPEIRSEASQVLSRRDARDFAGLLIGLLDDEIKYKAASVGGPASGSR